ncbi:hypothetical protein P9847_03375 [Paenibacillus chibensis]|uniref:DUF6199 domain-containing protein n=1 Tax=Paenibacillus chibensis TaxID=59846 RepID=A0ABU6PQB4_9BACL|nr:hypothetical protein [Paenibacillus chibensis]
MLIFMLFFFAAISFALGILSLRKPDWSWYMNEGWKTRGDSEPSDAYLDMVKFRGFLGIVVGSFFAACGILVTWSSL